MPRSPEFEEPWLPRISVKQLKAMLAFVLPLIELGPGGLAFLVLFPFLRKPPLQW